jgi:hypothetical protein
MRTRTRIQLWSSPRNISTALLYAFDQRADTTAVDEPLYAHYLTHQPTRAEHPGRAEILASQDPNGMEVVSAMRQTDYGTPVVVFKQMTHHLIGLNTDFLSEMRNVLLIRDPRRILASFGRVVEAVTAADIGIPQQAALHEELTERGVLTAVIDARRLLQDPADVLSRLCDRLGLDFDPGMLSWTPGPKPFDGCWATYWYATVHRSTGFAPYREKEVRLPPELERIAEACEPVYQQLLKEAL